MNANGSLSEDWAASGAGPQPAVWREGTRMVVALRGEQDLCTAPSVVEALTGAGAAGDGDVVVDLSGVLFMDTAIVTALVAGRENLWSQSRVLTLRAPSRIAHRILDLCNLIGLIEPISVDAAGAIGSCVTVRGTWSRAERRRRVVKAPPLPVQAMPVPAPVRQTALTVRAV